MSRDPLPPVLLGEVRALGFRCSCRAQPALTAARSRSRRQGFPDELDVLAIGPAVASGGEGRLGRSPSGVGGASPKRFVDDQARVSMAALAQPPHHPRHPRASPSHPPPLPLPATRLRRAGGGRSEKP